MIINILTSVCGLALIVSAGASPYLIDGMGYWSAIGGVLAGLSLIVFKGEDAQELITLLISKWNGTKKTT